MKLFAVALLFTLLPFSAEAAPKSVVVAVSELPPQISVVTSTLSEGWYGFMFQVNLKSPSSSPKDSWSANIVLKKENDFRHYLLSAPIKPSFEFRNKDGQLLTAETQQAEIVSFWSTVHTDLLKDAWVQLRDNDKMIIYEIKLWTSPGLTN